MSGLFLNFYTVEISKLIVDINYLEYENYSTKESFKELQNSYPDIKFYRLNDKTLILSSNLSIELPNVGNKISLNLNDNAKVVSKIIENAIIDFANSSGYKIRKNKYSNTWEIVSSRNILGNNISGLVVNRIVHFATHFFSKGDKLILGFSLSTSLKNSFTWSKSDFVKGGIDIHGLKGDEDRIFANRQSLKRFLESRGATNVYDNIIKTENLNSKSFLIIEKFYEWLDNNK